MDRGAARHLVPALRGHDVLLLLRGRGTSPQETHTRVCVALLAQDDLCGVCCLLVRVQLLDSFVYRFLYSCTSPHDQYAMSYVRKYALGMVRVERLVVCRVP
jgi:hypothetical protein